MDLLVGGEDGCLALNEGWGWEMIVCLRGWEDVAVDVPVDIEGWPEEVAGNTVFSDIWGLPWNGLDGRHLWSSLQVARS